MARNDKDSVIDTLMRSAEPSIRWKVSTRVVGDDPDSRKAKDLCEEIRKSPRVRALLADCNNPSFQRTPVYSKWRGAHWTLATLAEIGYPPGDERLLPLRDRVLDTWLADVFFSEFESKLAIPKSRISEGVPKIQGRYRRCASQQGYALYAITKLGLSDQRSDRLAERLMHWQWPDGGWNCDRKPSAHVSSFNESQLPMLGLAAYSKRSNDQAAHDAAKKASEIFLSRRLFRRLTDGTVISPHWTRTKYPRYWHYDMLGGLVAMAEMDLIGDSRCQEALELLERKELPTGGWSAEGRFYRVSDRADTTFGSNSPVGWGTSGRRMNEWVTADALYVLRAGGRIPA